MLKPLLVADIKQFSIISSYPIVSHFGKLCAGYDLTPALSYPPAFGIVPLPGILKKGRE